MLPAVLRSTRLRWLRLRLRGGPGRRLLLLVAIVLPLTFVPMAGTLGYFAALLLAPVYSGLAVFIGVDRAQAGSHGSDGGDGSGETSATLHLRAIEAVQELALTWLVGLALLLLGMLWNRNCAPGAGLLHFLMAPVASSLIALACGLAAGSLLRTRRHAVLLGFLPFGLCLLVSAWRLYHEPVVFAFDPFWGWFSGPIYDEGVAVDARYLRYRLYNALWCAAALLAMAGLDFGRTRRRAGLDLSAKTRLGASALLVVLGIAGFVRADDLGFTATHASIEERLSGTRETPHFVIHYLPRGETARQIDAVATEHEFAWSQLASMLGRAPTGKIHSYVFPSAKERRRLLGAGRPEVSMPWKGELYLSEQPFPHPALHHELAHAFLGEFGDPLLGLSISGARINIGLVEGVPTALAPPVSGSLDLHDQAAALDRLGKRPELASLMGLGFWSRASSRAYTSAGSFTLWLRQTHGAASIAELYDNAGDFEATYGESLEVLEGQWLAYLRERPISAEDLASVAARFRQRSVFRRPCAHRAAEIEREADRARQEGRLADARRELETLCEIEPEDPEHRLELARLLGATGDLEGAVAMLDEIGRGADLEDDLLARIDELRGDVTMLSDSREAAAGHYEAALARAGGESELRVLQLKRLAASDPELAPLFVRYFSTFDDAVEEGDLGLRRLYLATRVSSLGRHAAVGRYLTALQLARADELDEARTLLAAALDPAAGEGSLPGDELLRAARTLAMNVALRLGDYEGARHLLGELEADPTKGHGHALAYEQWRARIDFFESFTSDALPPATHSTNSL